MQPHIAGCIRAVTAIAGIVILECTAMATGHNGTLARLAFAAVAGLGGFALGSFLKRKGGN